MITEQTATSKRLALYPYRAEETDDAAFTRLMEVYDEDARRYARRLLDGIRHHIDDVVQEVWIKIWRNFPKYRDTVRQGGTCNWYGILMRAIWNRSVDTYRHERHFWWASVEDICLFMETHENQWLTNNVPTAVVEYAKDILTVPDYAYGYVYENEKRRDINTTLEQLSLTARQAQVFQLYQQGKSYIEIAAECDVNIGAVKSALWRIRGQLKRMFPAEALHQAMREDAESGYSSVY